RERKVVVGPDHVLRAETQVRVTEAIFERHARGAARAVAEGRHRRLVVATQRPSELDAAHPEALEREPARVAEEHTGLRVEAQREANRPRPRLSPADLADGHPPA